MPDRLTSTIDEVRPALTVVGSVDHRKPRDNKEHRIAEWKERFAARTIDVLYEAMDFLSHYAGGVLGNNQRFSESECAALMREALAIRTTSEGLEARRQMIRASVFDHIDLVLAEEGVPDPKNTSGYLAVPETGKKFTKEGAGLGPPVVDWDIIRNGVTVDQWELVIDREMVETPNRDKMADLVEAHPELAPLVRQAMTDGEPKTPKFHIRDLGDEMMTDED